MEGRRRINLGEDVEPIKQEKEEYMATLKEDEKNSMTKQRTLLIKCPASLEE